VVYMKMNPHIRVGKMSVMWCYTCCKNVDTDLMDHCEWEPFKCEDCVDTDYDPTPDEQGEPPISWHDYARKMRPR
jgi:hypothetical protein